MGNHPSVAGAAPPALVWGLDGEEELAAAAAAAAAASGSGSGSVGTEAGSGGSSSSSSSSSSGSGSSSRHGAGGGAGAGPADFGALFVEGEPWAEAQQRAAFLARVQRRLLDPALVAGLQLEGDGDGGGGGGGRSGSRRGEEAAADARERARAFEQALAAGALSGGAELLAALKPRLHEDLQSTVRPPPYLTTLRKRALLLHHLHPRVAAYRSAARRPLLRAPRAPPPLSAEESSLVRMACTMNRVCLVALKAIVQYSPSPAHPHAAALIKLPLLELHAMAQSFAPQCFFPEASLPLSPPEAPVGVEAGTASASSVDGARGAEKALDGQSNSYWSSKKRPGGATLWSVQLSAPADVSAVTLLFQQSFSSVLAPASVRVQLCYDPAGQSYETVGALRLDALTSAQAAAPLRVPCFAPAAVGTGTGNNQLQQRAPRLAHWVRLQLTGQARCNEQGYYGLKAVTIHHPRPDPAYIDVRAILAALQAWLATVSRMQQQQRRQQHPPLPLASSSSSSSSSPLAPPSSLQQPQQQQQQQQGDGDGELRRLALCAMERVACASGLLSSVLRFAFAVLEEDGEGDTEGVGMVIPTSEREAEEEEGEVDPALAEASRHLLLCVEEEERAAKGKMAQAIAASPLAPVLAAAFDPYEMSAAGLVLSEEGAHVRCATASHSHAYLNVGFKEGRWAWEFLIAEDITNDESICVGAGTKPVTSSSYNSSPNLWMYRCYNGNLYRKGGQISGVSKDRVHPGDTLRVELDHDAHTLRYVLNGDRDQGVCFTDVAGEVFPAVAFYGANRAVRLLAVEALGPAPGPGMRLYPAADPFKRRKWAGEMAAGLRHGFGTLTYAHGRGGWVGTWKQDRQHGLQAWVPAEGPRTTETVALHLFEADARRRLATPQDVAAAVREWDGWRCGACGFVSRRGHEACFCCGGARAAVAVPEEAEGGGAAAGQAVDGAPAVDPAEAERQALAALLATREGCCAAVLSRVASLGLLYRRSVGAGAAGAGAGGSSTATGGGVVAAGGAGAAGGDGADAAAAAPATATGSAPTSTAAAGNDGGDASGSSVAATSEPLTLPFCAEPRAEVFALLHALVVNRSRRRQTEARRRIVLAALRLLRTNFDRLVLAHVDPLDVGIDVHAPAPSEEAAAASSGGGGGGGGLFSLFPLRATLEGLMAGGSEEGDDDMMEVGQAAAEALAAGMELLYPDTRVRCALLGQLLAAHVAGRGREEAAAASTSSPSSSAPRSGRRRPRPGTGSGDGDSDGGGGLSGRATLLDRLLRRFGTNEGVVALLPTEDGQQRGPASASVEEATALLARLFEALALEETGALAVAVMTAMEDGEDSGGACASSSSFAETTTALLGAYLRQLLSSSSAPSSTNASSSVTPSRRMLVRFAHMALAHCRALLDAAGAAVAQGRLPPSAAEAYLQSTLVGQLLPLLGTAAPLLGQALWFAAPLAPLLAGVVQRLDALNSRLPGARAADAALREQERAGACGRWVSLRRSEVLAAAFDAKERSEDVSIEDGGRLFRSAASSNQHALANVGFKSGRAAWEFRLEADSPNDECSALGAAVKPITSSSYESCPNMWMRRSYNGQLYHGTSAGYGALAKVHPGDVVRVEVDLDAHTLSFKRNGEEEGVAFTDLEGEIFPAVCTYRAGIEVRLLKVECWSGEAEGLEAQDPSALRFDGRLCAPAAGHAKVDECDNSFAHVDREHDGRWATARTTRPLPVAEGARHVWEVCVKRCGKAVLAVGVCGGAACAPAATAEAQLGMLPGAWAWRMDGTLWAHGRQVAASYGSGGSGKTDNPEAAAAGAAASGSKATASAAGPSHLLTDGDVVTCTLDTATGTLAFAVNGRDLGVAFGPPGSGAEAEGDGAAVVLGEEAGEGLYPAASLKHFGDRVAIRPAGTVGTVALPWLLDLEHTLAAAGALLAGTVTAGPRFSPGEMRLAKWAASPLLRPPAVAAAPPPAAAAVEEEEEMEEDEMDLEVDGLPLAELLAVPTGEGEEEQASPPRRPRGRKRPLLPPAAPAGGDAVGPMQRFLALVLPSSDAASSQPAAAEGQPQPPLARLAKWLDPHGGGRITKRLCKAYPQLAAAEAACLAALCCSAGVAAEALAGVLERADGAAVAPPSERARWCGKKMQELRMALIRKHQALKEEQARREAAAEEEAEAAAAAAGKGSGDEDDEEKTEEEETEALTLVPAHRAGQPSEGSLLSLGAGSAAEEEDEQPPLASTGLLSTASLDGSGGAGSVGSGRTAVLKFAPSARVDLLRSDSMDSAVSPGTPLALMEEELRMARETADAETDAARAAAGRPPLPVPPTGAGRRQRHRTSDSASSFLSLPSSGAATTASQQPPTVPAFATAAEALLAKARFVLAVLGDHPAAAADDDNKGDDNDATTTVHDARLQACAELLLAQDLQDVGQLQQLLARRRARAACRRHGLRCYRALICATAGLSSVQAHAIAHLRAAMAPRALLPPSGSAGVAVSEAQAPEAQQQQVPPAAAAASASGSRALVGAGGHHYLVGLEGIPPALADAVRGDFVALYSALLGLVGRALEGRHVALACQALAAWALDFRPGGGQDAAFLLRAGLPSKLAGLLSLPGLVRCLGAAGENGAPQQWVAWPLQDVRAGLNEGRLTKRMVLEHMRACPEGEGMEVDKDEADEGMDIDALVARLSVGDVVRRYERLLRQSAAGRSAAAAGLVRSEAAAKAAARKARGVRYTYVVTATNGVGVRHLPDTRAERTGHSYKQHEVVEVSYRLRLSSGQTYLRLAPGGAAPQHRHGGWVFDVGVRGSYKDRSIMRCVAIEPYAEAEDEAAARKARAGSGSPLIVVPRAYGNANGSSTVDVPPSARDTVYYKDLAGRHLVLVRGAVGFPVLASSEHDAAAAVPSYFEVTVRCAGAEGEVCVGLAAFKEGQDGETKLALEDAPPGYIDHTCALHARGWAVWANGTHVRTYPSAPAPSPPAAMGPASSGLSSGPPLFGSRGRAEADDALRLPSALTALRRRLALSGLRGGDPWGAGGRLRGNRGGGSAGEGNGSSDGGGGAGGFTGRLAETIAGLRALVPGVVPPVGFLAGSQQQQRQHQQQQGQQPQRQQASGASTANGASGATTTDAALANQLAQLARANQLASAVAAALAARASTSTFSGSTGTGTSTSSAAAPEASTAAHGGRRLTTAPAPSRRRRVSFKEAAPSAAEGQEEGAAEEATLGSTAAEAKGGEEGEGSAGVGVAEAKGSRTVPALSTSTTAAVDAPSPVAEAKEPAVPASPTLEEVSAVFADEMDFRGGDDDDVIDSDAESAAAACRFPPLKDGDVLGCGLDRGKGLVFFTYNGRRLPGGVPLARVVPEAATPRAADAWSLVPLMSLHSHCETVEANFGPDFAYRPGAVAEAGVAGQTEAEVEVEVAAMDVVAQPVKAVTTAALPTLLPASSGLASFPAPCGGHEDDEEEGNGLEATLGLSVPEVDALHATAWPLLQLLAVQGVEFAGGAAGGDTAVDGGSSSNRVAALPSSGRGLAHACLGLLGEQLRLCAGAIAGRREAGQGPQQADNDALSAARRLQRAEPAKVESLAFRHLLQLLPLVEAAGIDPRAPVMQLLLSGGGGNGNNGAGGLLPAVFPLLCKGSPRVQRLGLRVLRRALAVTTPVAADAAAAQYFAGGGSVFGQAAPQPAFTSSLAKGVSSVDWLLGRISRTLGAAAGLQQPREEEEDDDDAETGAGWGHARMALACEEACLLRSLLAQPQWRPAVWAALRNALAAGAPAVEAAAAAGKDAELQAQLESLGFEETKQQGGGGDCGASSRRGPQQQQQQQGYDTTVLDESGALRPLLQALAALFVLADQDMLRVGGAVERALPGGAGAVGISSGSGGLGGVERFTVVRYRRGDEEVVVTEDPSSREGESDGGGSITSKPAAPGSTAGASNSTGQAPPLVALPIGLFAAGAAVPVPEVATPRLNEELTRPLLGALHALLAALPTPASETDGSPLAGLLERLRTLALCALRTLLAHFRQTWSEPLIPRIAAHLFRLALDPVPLPFCPPTARLEARLQLLQERTYETVAMGPAYLAALPRHERATAPGAVAAAAAAMVGPEGKEDKPLYRVVLKEGAVVRAGVSIDASPRVRVLRAGTVVEVLEACNADGVTRLRIKDGWISERCHGGAEDVIVERVTRAMADGVSLPPALVGAGEVVIEPSKVPEGGVKHRMHEMPLKLVTPAKLYPDNPCWDCDHCGATHGDEASTAFAASLGPGRAWLLCINCFASDQRALALARGLPPPPPHPILDAPPPATATSTGGSTGSGAGTSTGTGSRRASPEMGDGSWLRGGPGSAAAALRLGSRRRAAVAAATGAQAGFMSSAATAALLMDDILPHHRALMAAEDERSAGAAATAAGTGARDVTTASLPLLVGAASAGAGPSFSLPRRGNSGGSSASAGGDSGVLSPPPALAMGAGPTPASLVMRTPPSATTTAGAGATPAAMAATAALSGASFGLARGLTGGGGGGRDGSSSSASSSSPAATLVTRAASVRLTEMGFGEHEVRAALAAAIPAVPGGLPPGTEGLEQVVEQAIEILTSGAMPAARRRRGGGGGGFVLRDEVEDEEEDDDEDDDEDDEDMEESDGEDGEGLEDDGDGDDGSGSGSGSGSEGTGESDTEDEEDHVTYRDALRRRISAASGMDIGLAAEAEPDDSFDDDSKDDDDGPFLAGGRARTPPYLSSSGRSAAVARASAASPAVAEAKDGGSAPANTTAGVMTHPMTPPPSSAFAGAKVEDGEEDEEELAGVSTPAPPSTSTPRFALLGGGGATPAAISSGHPPWRAEAKATRGAAATGPEGLGGDLSRLVRPPSSAAAAAAGSHPQQPPNAEPLPNLPRDRRPLHTWRGADEEKLGRVRALCRATGCPPSLCRAALELAAGDESVARRWLGLHGLKYLPRAGRAATMYPAVFMALGFAAAGPAGADDRRLAEMAALSPAPGSPTATGGAASPRGSLPLLGEEEEEEEGQQQGGGGGAGGPEAFSATAGEASSGAVLQRLGARLGHGEAEEVLLYEGARGSTTVAGRRASASSAAATATGNAPSAASTSGATALVPATTVAAAAAAAQHELVFEEAVLEPLEVERASPRHKVVVGLVCTRCRYLEFPGCSQHAQLLSVRKPNGHGKCARCSCATDLHSPWDKGCRVCRAPTEKCFWAMTVRETQFLLRAFPPRCRAHGEDSCELHVLRCPGCHAVGFPGVGTGADCGTGTVPALCVRTAAGPFTVASPQGTEGHDGGLEPVVLPAETWYPRLPHVGGCPRQGLPLKEVRVRVSFSEAKYLCKTAASVETYARYVTRARRLPRGALVALTEVTGPVDALLGRVGVVARVQDQDDEVEKEGEGAVGERVTVDVYDEERGRLVPVTVPAKGTRVLTHMFGQELPCLGEEEDGEGGGSCLATLRRLSAATAGMLAARYAREALVWMLSHWSPHHPPTPAALGIPSWRPFIQLFKYVGLAERAFGSGPVLAGGRAFDAVLAPVSPASALAAAASAELSSALVTSGDGEDDFDHAAAAASGAAAHPRHHAQGLRLASLSAVLKRQVALWLRAGAESHPYFFAHDAATAAAASGRSTPTFASHGPDSLFQALLTDSLENLYSIALGQTLTAPPAEAGGVAVPLSTDRPPLPPKPAMPLPLLPPPPPPMLRRASSSTSYATSYHVSAPAVALAVAPAGPPSTPSATATAAGVQGGEEGGAAAGPMPILVRQSLHPFFGPCSYGEEVRLPGAGSLRVTLDARTALGPLGSGEATLSFWRSEDEPRRGIRPFKRFPGKHWRGLLQQQQQNGGSTAGAGPLVSFVVPHSDRVYYSFEARGGPPSSSSALGAAASAAAAASSSRGRGAAAAVAAALPKRLELEPTNPCRDDYALDAEGTLVRCLGGFPSLAPKDVLLTSGRWYYEVTMVKAGLAQLGWADARFAGHSARGEGVGDDHHSWGLDGHRVYKWHGGGVRWGRAWADGDVVGFAADLDRRTLSFSLNGEWAAPMGLAFEDVAFAEGLRPCLTLNKSCAFRVNFGADPARHSLRFPPPPGHRPVAEAPRDQAVRRSYWGYRFEVAPAVGLQTKPVADFKPLWRSSGVGVGGQEGGGCTIWRPKAGSGHALFGDVVTLGGAAGVKPEATLVVADDDSPYLAPPRGYQRVLTLEGPPGAGGGGGAGALQGCVWRPLPPDGFVALGDVFAPGYAEPELGLMRCLRRDAVEPAPLYRRTRVWRGAYDDAEGEDESGGAVALATAPGTSPRATLWGVGNGCGTFVVTRGFGAPGSKGFLGRGWRLRPTLPGAALHQHWASEQEAAAAPSMEWALWVLDCFLETCAPWELTAGGILAGRTYEALVRCIVDAPACTDRTRAPAASLLTRLLRTRRALLLGGMPPTEAGGLPLLSRRALAELPTSVRALGRVTPDLLRLCRARVQAQGRLFLPRDLQQVVELVTTVNWGLPRTMALLHPLAPTATATAVAAVSLLRRAARGDRPTDAEALVDLMALVEFFGAAPAGTEQGLGLGQHAASPPLPPPFCATTLRAWLEARGCAAVVESAHPLRLPAEEDGDEKAAAEAFGGEVALDGAETVEVVFDGRSALPAGVTLLLTGGNPNPGAPPVDWEAGTGLITWRGGCAGGGADFATRLLFRGPRLRWRLEKGPVSAAAVGSGAKRKRAAKGVGGAAAGGEAGRDGEEQDLLASLSQAIDQLALRPDDKPASTLPTAPISVGGGIGGGGAAAAAIHDIEGGAEVWGVGFTVLAKRLPPAARLRQLQGAVEERALVDAFPRGGAWSVEHDAAIVEWLNAAAEALGREGVEVSPFDFRHGGGDTTVGLQLRDAPVPLIYLRIALIQGFNRLVQQLLPMVDLGNACRHSLGHRLRGLAHLVLRDVKMAVVDAGKERTQGSGGNALTITLDNFAASRSMEAGEAGIRASRCIFVQAFRALHHKDSRLLRSCWDGDRVFQVTFRGENGSDAGGVFREGMSRVVEDLHNPQALDLLAPCPNARHGLPTNVDKSLPNPRLAGCPLAGAMLEFVGKLMGMSLRAHLCLPFQFPSLVWKRLLGQELTRGDMEAVDTLTCRLLDSVRACATPEEFDAKFGGSLTFVVTGHDGAEVELFPGGSAECVAFETREAYSDLLADYHLHEYDAQIQAIARGLYALVPRDTLLLLTWRELETLVCGSPSFDLAFWRRHTTYSGYTDEDVTVQLFWKVLASLSQEEQSGFVRFAWGRSRLPPKHAWFKDMQISRRNTGEDSLPASHTCFFSIELPPYKTEAAMRKGLLTAIHYGMVGILNT